MAKTQQTLDGRSTILLCCPKCNGPYALAGNHPLKLVLVCTQCWTFRPLQEGVDQLRGHIRDRNAGIAASKIPQPSSVPDVLVFPAGSCGTTCETGASKNTPPRGAARIGPSGPDR